MVTMQRNTLESKEEIMKVYEMPELEIMDIAESVLNTSEWTSMIPGEE